MTRKWLRTTLIALASLLVAAVAAIQLELFSSGPCRTDEDCPQGQQCMKVSVPQVSVRTLLQTYKVCRTPCSQRSDCAPGYFCAFTSHGPGPGSFCYPEDPGP